MRKRVKILAILFSGAMLMIACKKEWTCNCTYKADDQTMTYKFTIEDTKKNAKEDCESYTIVGASELKCELE